MQPRTRFISGVSRRIRGRREDIPPQRQPVLGQRVPEIRFGIRLRVPVGPLHAPPPPVIPVLEHVLVLGIERPIITLPFAAALAGHLHEALVQAEIVPYRILPALLVPLEIREFGGYVRVDL